MSNTTRSAGPAADELGLPDADRDVRGPQRLHALDAEADLAYEALTRLAAQVCDTPIAVVSRVDADRQWSQSTYGIDAFSGPRGSTFCDHAVGQADVFIVRDTRLDERFAAYPLVTDEPWIRFYAGVPLVLEGAAVGTLCVLDVEPRTLSAPQIQQLLTLGQQVVAEMLLRQQISSLADELEQSRQAQSALSEAEQRWRSIVEQSSVAAVVVGLDGRFHYLNPRAVALSGAESRDDLKDASLFELLPADFREAAQQLFARIAAGEVLIDFPCTIGTFTGASVDCELNAALVNYGGVAAVQLELRDVTDAVAAHTALGESEARWHRLVNESPIGIGVFDENEILITANQALCALLGRAESELLGRHPDVLAHPEDSATGQVAAEAMIRSGRVVRLEKRILRPDGESPWVWITASQITAPSGALWTVAQLQDVTDRKVVEQALVESEAEMTAVAQVVKRVQSGEDARYVIVEAAQKLADAHVVTLLQRGADSGALRVTASTDTDLLGIEVPLSATSATVEVFLTGKQQFFADPTESPAVSPRLLELARSRSLYLLPVKFAGSVTAVLAVSWGYRVDDPDDQRARVVQLLADNIGVGLRQADLMEQLQQLATTDPLTTLPNRRNWDDRLAVLLQQAQRTSTSLTVALADLDHFKQFNDSNGHLAGDQLLREFAGVARNLLRGGDVVARWGGEEFAFALPHCVASEATRVLERVRLGVPREASVSIGVATWDGNEDASHLMTRADEALYRAKSGGRNQVVAAL